MKRPLRMWRADLGVTLGARGGDRARRSLHTCAFATQGRKEVLSSPQLHDSERIVRDLVALLHQGAPADEFAARLAEVESLPDDGREKSSLVELVRMAMAVRNRLE